MDSIKNIYLRVDYLKTWISTTLAFIAGETTLATTILKGNENLIFAHVSIALFIVSIILWLGAFEAIAMSLSKKPDPRNQILSLLYKITPKKILTAWLFSLIGAIPFAFGLVLFGFFLFWP
ncbi:hypothetical protein [Ectothiorhodospira mobilis]|uniref:hypothetical protein n=1 Tax=Ectothiorhodospira mobilis TaxID=195064 RepID=UPI001EE78420|nr:hypothetical protein [Ectothiorhodospira mobilis]MCG5534663.1 hypothetical protein [Ectothiorhodospira mobilis]